jgi:type VI secretion system protein ImpM
MPCALFGKLIGKRDFISVNTPRDLLLAWEGWLQASLSSSKNELLGQWLKAYLQAPLWRFWLGAEVCGLPVMGVFMSSMDGVGRHFPLTVFTFPAAGMVFDPPCDGFEQTWYEAAENFLLFTIDAGEDYETVLARFGALADGHAAVPVHSEACVMRHGAIIAMSPQQAQTAEAMSESVGEQPDIVMMNQSATGGAAESPAPDPAVDDQAPATDAVTHVDAAPMVPADEVAVAVALQEDALAQVQPQIFGFAALRQVETRMADVRRTYWWTIGGHDLPAMAMAAEGLPDPQLMTVMLTGANPGAAS